MRSVLLSCSLLALGACATVSMVPGEASVETGIGAEKSALQTASIEFCDGAETKGWIKASNGLAGLANMLMYGRDDDARQGVYSELIEADTAAPGDVVARIAADAEAARLGLANVSAEAVAILTDPQGEASRADVTSYERALVRAQKVARAFTEALETVSARTDDTAPAQTGLTRFNTEIDAARRTADKLAARYASLGDTSI